MIRKASQRGYQLALPGIERKTLAYGERALLTEFRMRKGSTLPRHAHPQEQTGYLVSGHIRLSIGRRTVVARPGASWSIPGDTPHGAEILADSVAIEVFAPVRKDYLPRTRIARRG
jgi:quercetin dioxygenase-like cupin family protein